MRAAGKRRIVYPRRSTEIRIWNLADLHWMSKGCAENRLKDDIKEIRDDPYSFWFGGGDYCDFIGYKDKRFDPDAVADWVTVKEMGRLAATGYTGVAKLLRPIAHKCLGLLEGNHERVYELHTEQQERTQWLCCELNTPNLGYAAFVDVVLARDPKAKRPTLVDRPGAVRSGDSWRIRFCLHHGAGFAQTPAGKLKRLIDFMEIFEADVYMMGHVHDQSGKRSSVICADRQCKELVSREKIGVISGSYLQTYKKDATLYGEQRMYKPTILGAASITLIPGGDGKPNRIKAEI